MGTQMGIMRRAATAGPRRDGLTGPSGHDARRYQPMAEADLRAAVTNPAAGDLVRVPAPVPGPDATTEPSCRTEVTPCGTFLAGAASLD
ncbi:hypothetical protein [Amycolatopsis thailandensis]|uniref:hypothetical protein n=1 Tax=Amycolatopsis thailandensis TaxID=589330 RepID=UPI00142E2A85|nr:hypothetical protein [Amycolatopsis thailandensis]